MGWTFSRVNRAASSTPAENPHVISPLERKFQYIYLIFIFTFFLTAQTLTIKSTPSGPTYVKLGENLTLDVTYTYTGSKGVNVEWSKNNSALVRKFDDGTMTSFDKRASVKGEASFVLTNIELNDNGTFTVALAAKDVSSASILRNVIVFVQGTFLTMSYCFLETRKHFLKQESISWNIRNVWTCRSLMNDRDKLQSAIKIYRCRGTVFPSMLLQDKRNSFGHKKFYMMVWCRSSMLALM